MPAANSSRQEEVVSTIAALIAGPGSYVGIEQPAQTTVIAKGAVARQTVVEGRVMLQAAF